MSSDRLIYLPLGGAGEIGMNAYLYGYGPEGAERFILVDLGVTFPDMDTTPGVDLILPDISWLEERRDRLDGIFITHAHEDHIGAIGHLWQRLAAPIYARTFTAHIGRLKLEDHGIDPGTIQTVSPWPAQMQAGIFWGYVGLVKEICARVKGEYDREMRVIGTGGLAPLFAQGDVLFDGIEDDLTMHGLTVIHQHNKDNA